MNFQVALKQYPEASKELAQTTKHFLYADVVLSPTDHVRINDMAMLLVNPEQVVQYPTWKARSELLDISLTRMEFYRRTPAWQQALREAVKLRALEASSIALSAMEVKANDGDTRAYDKLLQVADLKSATSVQIGSVTNNTVNLSYEQKIAGLLSDRVAQKGPVVDVVAEPVPSDPGTPEDGSPAPAAP
jgi:hypothetical protein